MKRRRYDTVELVAQIKRERRNGLFFGAIGLGLAIFVFALYLVGIGGTKPAADPDQGGTAKAADASAPGSGSTPAVDSPTSGVAKSESTAARGVAKGNGVGGSGSTPHAAGKKAGAAKGKAAAKPRGKGEVKVVLRKKAVLWIDGAKVGKVRKHVASLAAGSHTIKVKHGKRIIEHSIEVNSGKRSIVRVDVAKRRVQSKSVSMR